MGAAITAIYILRLIAKAFFGPVSSEWEDLTDSNLRERFAASILVFTILLIGLWPYPFVEVIKHGVGPILSGIVGAI